MNELRFGVNYVPSKDWFYSWQNLDMGNVEADIAAIASLGVDHIRMHLRWDLFQPNDTFVSDEMIGKLKDVLDIVWKYALKAEVTVFNGWMSGFWFLPSHVWNENVITSEKQFRNQVRLLEALSAAIANHPALMGIDIGNEFNVYGMMIKPFSVQEGDSWLKRILQKTDELFPNKINVLGVDHQPWYTDAYMSRKTLANTGTLTSVHSWAKFTGAIDSGVFSEECLTLQEYNVEMANAYADNIRRGVWVQEFGISSYWTEEKNFEKFVESTMLNAMRSENLFGFTFWCSHNVDERFTFPEIEYDLGLFDINNNLKPLGQIYKNTIAKIKSGAQPLKLETGYGYVIDENAKFDGWKYAKVFAEHAREGRHIQFVLGSKKDDEAYLQSRNINKLIVE